MPPFPKSTYVCNRCDVQFNSRTDMKHHNDGGQCVPKRKKSKKRPRSSLINVTRCLLCGFETNQSRLMKDHMKKFHKDFKIKADSDAPAGSTSTQSRVNPSKKRQEVNPPESMLVKVKQEPEDIVPVKVQGILPELFSPIRNDMQRCRVCLKTNREVELEKAEEVNDYHVASLAKLNASTAAALNFLNENGRMRIQLYFCHPCKRKIQIADRLLEDLKNADEHFKTIVQSLVALGKAVVIDNFLCEM